MRPQYLQDEPAEFHAGVQAGIRAMAGTLPPDVREPDETDSLPSYTDADAPQQETREEFQITDEASANWLLRKLANIEAEKQRVLANAVQIVKQLEADADGLRYCYEGQLQEYVRRALANAGSRRKSLTLLQGTASFRTVGASLKISDPVAALDFCRRNLPAAVKTVETLDAAKYRDFAEKMKVETDALPAGVEGVPARENFTVKF